MLSKAKQALNDTFTQAACLLRRGEFHSASELLEARVRECPFDSSALHFLGICYCRLGRIMDGADKLKEAFVLSPDDPGIVNNLGSAYFSLNEVAKALECYERAIAIDKHFADAHFNRANLFASQARFKEALAGYEVAAACAPSSAAIWMNHANALVELQRPDLALISYDKVLRLDPGHIQAYLNKSRALMDLRQYDAAVLNCDCALRLNHKSPEAHYSRGNALMALHRMPDAIAEFKKATQLTVDYALAHWNEAICHLLVGDYEQGWMKFEWRQRVPVLVQPILAGVPLWTGKDSLQGKTILLYAEEGAGDTIQFSRYVPLVKSLGAQVILAVPEAIGSLMLTLAPDIDIVFSINQIPHIDFQSPLMGLPRAFGSLLKNIPTSIPYLGVTEQCVSKWSRRLGPMTHRYRIGLAWSGNPNHKNDNNRSLPLSLLLAYLDTDKAEFISLQKDLREHDKEVLKSSTIRSFSNEFCDFSDTAGLISQLDLVVTVDTSVAHLAGALGKPVWILLPNLPDWRWMLDREDSPWYPTARLFRQTQPGNWSGVLEKLQLEIDMFVGNSDNA